jgi:hypothetical protein
MAAAPELTDDEYTVLDYLYEMGWEDESFAALRPIAVGAADVPRLRRAVTGLFDKSLVEIRQTRDFDPDPPGRPLAPPEATAALEDDRAWAVPGEEPLFDGTGDYYVVVPRPAAIDAYQRARESGKPHACWEVGFAKFESPD